MKIIKKLILKLNLTRLPCIFFYIFRIFPIKNNKIVFVNFGGKGYGDNPKYISKIIEERKEYDVVWLVNDKKNIEFPKNIRTVKNFTLKSIYELSTAKVWINNRRFDQYIAKRKNQYYIQTWHGGLSLKRIEYDAYEKLSEYYRKVMKNDNKLIDLMLSNSDFCTNMYRRAFKYDGEILEKGSPRNDCLVNNQRNILSEKVRKFYNIDNKKILLYAPTFRNSYEKNPYDIDFEKLVNLLEQIDENKWEVIIRLHPNVKNPSDVIENIDYYINASSYGDTQELICACDLLITDYSSTMFEAMIADKPVIIYANDLNDYENERGTYFTLSELPFPIAENNDELLRLINKKDIKNIKVNYKRFKNKVGLKESGKSAEEVVKIIEKITKIS